MGRRAVLVDIAYSTQGEDTLIHLVLRTESKEKEIVTLLGAPYFYVDTEKEGLLAKLDPSLSERIKGVERGFTSLYGEKLTRIYTFHPADVPPLRNRLQTLRARTYEARIEYCLRFLIDSGIKVGVEIEEGSIKPSSFYIEPRYWILDIETLYEKGAREPRAYSSICCIGFYDSYDQRYYILYQGSSDEVSKEGNTSYISVWSERDLLERFYDFLARKDPDLLVGFALQRFDIPIIVEASRRAGLDPRKLSPLGMLTERRGAFKIQGRPIVDIYLLARMLLGSELEEHTLDFVNKKLGLGKGKYSLGGRSVPEVWAVKPSEVLIYNRRDLECVKEIIDRQHLIRCFLDEIRRLSGVRYEDILSKKKLVDVYLLRMLSGKVVLPTFKRARKKKAFKGALILDPEPGLYEDVGLLDFDSLYPSCIISFNLGITTLDPEGDIILSEGEEEYRFRSKPRSLLARALEDLLIRREESKRKVLEARDEDERKILEKQDAALKALINSYFGVVGHETFRLYEPSVGAAITLAGRLMLREAISTAEELGLEVIYGDTDSLFVRPCQSLGAMENLAEAINQRLEERSTEWRPDHLPWRIKIKCDAIFERLAIWSKKRYLGKYIWRKGEFRTGYEWKGLEAVRSDVSPLVRELQKKLGISIVEGRGAEERRAILEEIQGRITKREISFSEAASPRQLRKSPEEYKTLQAHVRAALYSNKHLGFNLKKGDKPKWLYVKAPLEYPETDVLAFLDEGDIPEGFEIDYEKLIEKIQPKVDSFLSIVGERFTFQAPTPSRSRQRGQTLLSSFLR